MVTSANDGVPFTQARDNSSELAEQAEPGAEQSITKNHAANGALVHAGRLDEHHRLERDRIHLRVIEDARRGLADITAGRTFEADGAIAQVQQRRKAAARHPDLPDAPG